MTKYTEHIKPYVLAEIRTSVAESREGNSAQAFTHLENAYVLGQDSTSLHVIGTVNIHLQKNAKSLAH